MSLRVKSHIVGTLNGHLLDETSHARVTRLGKKSVPSRFGVIKSRTGVSLLSKRKMAVEVSMQAQFDAVLARLNVVEQTNLEMVARMNRNEQTNLEMAGRLNVSEQYNHEMAGRLNVSEQYNHEMAGRLNVSEQYNDAVVTRLNATEQIYHVVVARLNAIEQTNHDLISSICDLNFQLKSGRKHIRIVTRVSRGWVKKAFHRGWTWVVAGV